MHNTCAGVVLHACMKVHAVCAACPWPWQRVAVYAPQGRGESCLGFSAAVPPPYGHRP